MKQSASEQAVSVKIYDSVQLHPTAIRHLHADPASSRLYVARQDYSEICELSLAEGVVVQQLAELEPCEYLLELGGVLAMFKPFQLKLLRDGRWEAHSFTTQLLSIRVEGTTVYSFHERETVSWNFRPDDFTYRFLPDTLAPYHLDAAACIVGFGKRLQNPIKNAKLTTCAAIPNKWFFAGDEKGAVHVFDWKMLSHVKSFHQHCAPILALKVDATSNTVYFSGSDSQICMIRLVGEEWRLGGQVRGQSHDVMSLELMGEWLISGGITTDLCFNGLEAGELTGEFTHKVSYTSARRVESAGKMVVVNQRNCFEIWQMGSSAGRTQLLVKYQMPADKFIVDCRIYGEPIEADTYLLLVVTDQDTIGWKFNPQTGLNKYITIQNQYVLTHLLPRHVFLGLRADGQLERVNCTTGKIEEVARCDLQLPSDLIALGSGLVLIGSRLERALQIVSLRKEQTVASIALDRTYTYLGHLQGQVLLMHYFNDKNLYKLDYHSQKQTITATLPVPLIRFGGWLASVTKGSSQVKAGSRKYWYGVSEGKVIVVANVGGEGKKKVRVRQTERVAQVIRASGKQLGCNLAIIPYNFRLMIDQLPLQPVFNKKIV